MRKNILITGLPKSGKSTLLKEIIGDLNNTVGFVTNEVLKGTDRIGFNIETSTGNEIVLARTDNETQIKVSKYYVDVENLNRILPEITSFSINDILYIDEIGQMQLFSSEFEAFVTNYLNSKNTCIATLTSVYQNQFIDHLKSRNDIILIEISPITREEYKTFIRHLLKKIEKARKYANDPKRLTFKEGKYILQSEHAIRILIKQDNSLLCDCDFSKKYHICSHIIATEEMLSNLTN